MQRTVENLIAKIVSAADFLIELLMRGSGSQRLRPVELRAFANPRQIPRLTVRPFRSPPSSFGCGRY
jgi:hypothetical protein